MLKYTAAAWFENTLNIFFTNFSARDEFSVASFAENKGKQQNKATSIFLAVEINR